MKHQESSPSRLDYIDGVRGVAVAMVLLFHTAIWSGLYNETGYQAAKHFYSLGRPGVDLFLVLSGFCLFRPMIDKTTGAVRPLNFWRYAMRRIRRIAPPFYAAIGCFSGAAYLVYRFAGPSWWGQPFQGVFPIRPYHLGADLLTHLLLIHGFFNDFAHSFDGAFWSLSLEGQFYVLLPLLVWIARRFSVGWSLALPIALTIMFRASIGLIAPEVGSTYVGSELSLSRWSEFGCGMGAAYLASKTDPTVLPRNLLRTGLLVSVAIAAVMEVYCGHLAPLMWGVAGALILLHPALFAGRMRAALSHRWIVFLGMISYSVYLIHGTVFELLAIPLSRSGNVQTRTLVYLLGGPMAAVLVGHIFHLVFERPFMSMPSPKTDRQTATVSAISPAP